MTDREKAIVMAYTGVCMLNGDKFQIFHKYVEDIMGRPVYTHEFGLDLFANEVKKKAEPDFMKLCEEDDYEIIKEYKEPKTDTLDKIRAKIEEGAKIVQHVNIEKAKALCWCLDVIDKYTKESEE